MASMETRALFWFTDIGSLLKFVPYNQDLRDYSCIIFNDPLTGQRSLGPLVNWGNKRHKFLYVCVNSLTMFLQVAAIAGGIWLDSTYDLSLLNRLQFYFLASVVSFFLGLQSTMLLFSKRMFSMQNTYLLFCMRLYDLHKIDQREKDGIEIYLKIMILLSIGCVTMFPVWIWVMNLNAYRFVREIGLGWDEMHGLLTAVGIIVTPVFVCFILLQGLILIFHYSSMALVYCNTVCRSLKLSRWSSDPEKRTGHRRKYELVSFYKAHIIYHNYVMEEANKVVLMSIMFAAGILISSLFAVIKYYEQLHPLLLVVTSAAAAFALVISKILFQLANYITDLSLEFKNSYLRNDLSLRPVERKRFRSCKELAIVAGSMFTVSRQSYIRFVNDVVLENVINLIINSQ